MLEDKTFLFWKPTSFKSHETRKLSGGVATICLSQGFAFALMRMRSQTDTFEYIATRIKHRHHCWKVLNIYRPGTQAATKLFFVELDKMISKMKYGPGDIIITGDMNVPLNIKRNSSQNRRSNRQSLLQVLSKHGLTQCVQHPTHEHGNLLDVVCSSVPTPVRIKETRMSDHGLLTSDYPSARHFSQWRSKNLYVEKLLRSFRH